MNVAPFSACKPTGLLGWTYCVWGIFLVTSWCHASSLWSSAVQLLSHKQGSAGTFCLLCLKRCWAWGPAVSKLLQFLQRLPAAFVSPSAVVMAPGELWIVGLCNTSDWKIVAFQIICLKNCHGYNCCRKSWVFVTFSKLCPRNIQILNEFCVEYVRGHYKWVSMCCMNELEHL